MNGKFLLDSNLLIYAYDRSEQTKQVKARNVLDWLQARRAGVLSTQVLGEFFAVATRKLAKPLTVQEAYVELEGFLRSFQVADVTRYIVLEAGRGSVRYQLPYWDAQLWATAKLNQIATVLSEDFANGSRIEGVQFVNPFTSNAWQASA